MKKQSVLQDWVLELGLRHQGVLLGGMRGCDTAPKNDPSKLLVRCLRHAVLNCFVGDAKKSVSYIEEVDDEELERRMRAFLKSCDHYPQHYVLHLAHTAQMIGYKKPDYRWSWFYQRIVYGFHLNPETERDMDARLSADERKFAELAEVGHFPALPS